jgi:hypothetical protein
LILVTGCKLANAPERTSRLHLEVFEDEYAVRLDNGFYRAEIPYRYTNHTGETLLITGCHPPRHPTLEWWNGDEWRPAFMHVELLCLSAPFVIAPEAVIDDTLRLQVSRDSVGPTGRLVVPYWEASHEVGDYRLVWSLKDRAPLSHPDPWLGGPLRPLAERASNTFRLRIESP